MDQSVMNLPTSDEDSDSDDNKMDDRTLIAVIQAELSTATGADGSILAQDRIRALDYYYNRPRGDEVAGRSKVQSTDVMDVIEWVLPDIIEAFTSNEDAVKFQPVSANDVPQARIESQYINHVFHTEAGGYLTLYEMFKDALLQKNGIVKTFWDKKTTTRYDEYEGLFSTELEQVIKSEGEITIEPYEHNQQELPLSSFPRQMWPQLLAQPEVQQQIQQIQQEVRSNTQQALWQAGYGNGNMLPPDVAMQVQQQTQQILQEAMQNVVVCLHNVKIKIHDESGQACCMPIPPETFRLNFDHPSIDVSNARFACHEVYDMTISDLIEMGVDQEVAENLPTADYNINAEHNARQYGRSVDVPYHNVDDSTRTVHFCDIWMRVDYDGDGVAELRHIWFAGDSKILLNEYADESPFTTCAAILAPHRWVGISLYDRIKQIQDISTSIWRNILDNFYRANNNRTVVVENQVNMDDLLNPRPSGAVRARNIDAVKPFPYQPIGVEAYQILEGLSRLRMERSGVGPEMMAEGMVIDNDTSHGVERLMSAKEKLVGMMIKNLGEVGVADVFLKLHNVIKKHQNKIRELEINGQWLQVDPRQWKYRKKPRVKVGLGAGDKIKHSAVLTKVLANQQLLSQNGMFGVLVDYKATYNALCDEARFAGIRNPEQYYLDPNSPQAQQQIQNLQQKAQQPSIEDKVLMLEAQIKKVTEDNKRMKHMQDYEIKLDEQERKRQRDEVDATLGFGELAVQKMAVKKQSSN